MKEIKEISEFIEETLEEAEKYSDYAIKYGDLNKNLADMYHRLSEEHLKFVDTLHDQGVKLIEEYAAKSPIPSDMKAVYEYLHKKHIDKFNEIKTKQTNYK